MEGFDIKEKVVKGKRSSTVEKKRLLRASGIVNIEKNLMVIFFTY